MKKQFAIWLLAAAVLLAVVPYRGQAAPEIPVGIDLYGDSIYLPAVPIVPPLPETLSPDGIQDFYQALSQAANEPLVTALLRYKTAHQLNDWLYYQLIRKTANALSPKRKNYRSYTLCKWFLLARSGYDATVRIISRNRILFYVQSDDNVYNIPYQISNGKQYVCLNYHDYENINLEQERAFQQNIHVPGAVGSFSYKVNQLPAFSDKVYVQKALRFVYHNKAYRFNIRLNPVMKDIFANYPVVDFESCFNIPLSNETYQSLIPELRAAIRQMDQQNGIDYLMHFTRYAFPFEKDAAHFGREKRLAPEETLLYEYSDCEDRAALFFYLVKELYNLPMITLLYPEHVTIAICFDKPYGKTIRYKDKEYTVCEPTPQAEDLKIGQLPTFLRKAAYDVGYEYLPTP